MLNSWNRYTLGFILRAYKRGEITMEEAREKIEELFKDNKAKKEDEIMTCPYCLTDITFK